LKSGCITPDDFGFGIAEGVSDDGFVAAEVTLPQTVAQDDGVG